jgi:hypothetical protein
MPSTFRRLAAREAALAGKDWVGKRDMGIPPWEAFLRRVIVLRAMSELLLNQVNAAAKTSTESR